jgi:bacterioferritin-associated ferredoxin
LYVCICSAVTDSEVRACIVAGADSVEEIGQHCAAGTGCGSCLEVLDDLLDERRVRRCAAA